MFAFSGLVVISNIVVFGVQSQEDFKSYEFTWGYIVCKSRSYKIVSCVQDRTLMQGHLLPYYNKIIIILI